MLRRAAISTDDYGGRSTDWVDLASVWAEHKPVSDGEQRRAMQVGSQLTDRFVILFAIAWADLNSKDQLTFAGRTYAIDGVKLVDDGRQLEITAVARSD